MLVIGLSAIVFPFTSSDGNAKPRVSLRTHYTPQSVFDPLCEASERKETPKGWYHVVNVITVAGIAIITIIVIYLFFLIVIIIIIIFIVIVGVGGGGVNGEIFS